MQDVIIIDSVRSGFAKFFRGKLNITRPDDLLAYLHKCLIREESSS